MIIRLLSASPFLLLSVYVGMTWTFGLCSAGVSSKKTSKAGSAATVSNVEMIRAGLSPVA